MCKTYIGPMWAISVRYRAEIGSMSCAEIGPISVPRSGQYRLAIWADTCRSLNQLRDCLQDVSIWMENSKLKLNADKTEFLAT